jgi:hypothetical protein
MEAAQRHRTGGTLSASAELMVDPKCGARCTVRYTGAAGKDCYHWTITLLGEDLPLAAGRTGELAEAQSQAEAALAAYVADCRELSGVGHPKDG